MAVGNQQLIGGGHAESAASGALGRPGQMRAFEG